MYQGETFFMCIVRTVDRGFVLEFDEIIFFWFIWNKYKDIFYKPTLKDVQERNKSTKRYRESCTHLDKQEYIHWCCFASESSSGRLRAELRLSGFLNDRYFQKSRISLSRVNGDCVSVVSNPDREVRDQGGSWLGETKWKHWRWADVQVLRWAYMNKHAGLIFFSPLCQNCAEQTDNEPGWRESWGRQTVVRQGWLKPAGMQEKKSAQLRSSDWRGLSLLLTSSGCPLRV